MIKKTEYKDIVQNNKIISETDEIDAKVFEIKENIQIKKIDCLKRLLESINLHDELSGKIGSEPVFKNTFNSKERGIIKHKLFKIIDQL